MNNIIIYTEKLRKSGLRPTRQRLKICEVLFSPEKTFHFTVNDLTKIIEKKLNEKISLATVYNTVHAFKKKGYLKEISINSDKSYFDTNTTDHQHFFDEDTSELIDCSEEEVDSVKVKNNITGKKIKSVEVLIRVASDNQSQN
jgi:Fur family iron response transcriptional regulator